MTDRTTCLIVALENTMREDDAQIIMDAIEMIKGVLKVKCVTTKAQDLMNEWAYKKKIQKEILNKLYDAFEDKED